jgi:hypothetical protein
MARGKELEHLPMAKHTPWHRRTLQRVELGNSHRNNR